MKKLIIIIFSLLGLVACGHSSQSEEQTTINHSNPKDQTLSTIIPDPEIEPFNASISVPNQINSNEEFVVKATLENLSDNDLTILHASRVFYFSIKDTNGKLVNTFVMAEVGKNRPFQGKGMISEQYIYKLENPGVYEVSATAKFTVGEGDNTKDFEIETNKVSFEVTPLN
ncbi:hypothetical protein J2T12_001476 [Paenibacillus anaericanus]|uniref:hypothetical protein n=1 Tax=Paenibacillus anaericanus TaxID=170367 RepID=UPI0027802B9A|nr:hypothetical protein [Paenibacillus anaericanus]MDQ0088070.1 hypothetical protein [Paenibacillus anaericanus]